MTEAVKEQFEHVVRLLEDSQGELERSLKGLDDEFCSAKPAVGGWSITEVIEHLTVIEERVTRRLQTMLPAGEPVPDHLNGHWKDAELIQQIQSYTNKIDAPEVVRPTGRYRSCQEALAAFNALRQSTLAYTASATPYLRGRLLPHPLFGPIDGCQWLLALGAHTQRHVKQIEAIKAAAHQ